MDQLEYVEMLEYSQQHQFICAVEELENLVVQCFFELSKENLVSTGEVITLLCSKVLILSRLQTA